MSTTTASEQLDKIQAAYTDSAQAAHLRNLKQTLVSERNDLSRTIESLEDELDELRNDRDSCTTRLVKVEEEEVALRKAAFDHLPAHVKVVPVTSADQVHVGAWLSHSSYGAVKVASVNIEDIPGGYCIVARGDRGSKYMFKVYRGEFKNISDVRTFVLASPEAG